MIPNLAKKEQHFFLWKHNQIRNIVKYLEKKQCGFGFFSFVGFFIVSFYWNAEIIVECDELIQSHLIKSYLDANILDFVFVCVYLDVLHVVQKKK